MAYNVKLEIFEGPMDLLLFLIKKEELDIYNIPISEITKQYLEYIQLMRMLNLEIAGEFIVMASTLIRIKSKMLLPKSEYEDTDEEDPRSELVRNLLEYHEYKKIANSLDEKQLDQSHIFYRSGLPDEKSDEDDEMLLDVSLFDLITAFKKAVEAAPPEIVHEIPRTHISLEERIQFVSQYLREKKQVRFIEMFPPGTQKLVLVVTFVALLELIKRHSIRVGQTKDFGEIWIYYNEP